MYFNNDYCCLRKGNGYLLAEKYLAISSSICVPKSHTNKLFVLEVRLPFRVFSYRKITTHSQN